jgi:tetratricopeptide (TPR) repeat protein
VANGQAIWQRIVVLNPEQGTNHIQPLSIRDSRLIDAISVDPNELAKRIAARLDGLTGGFGKSRALAPPQWFGSNMRLGSNRFVGRLPDLWAIHSGLSQGSFALITRGSTSLVQVQGMGGLGKTLLAEEYALRFGPAYPGGVFWLSAVAGDSLSAQVLRIAGHLGMETANLTPDEAMGLLRGTLSERGRYLWIVDDLPADADHDKLLTWSAPSVNGVTLVTTRNKRLKGSGFVHPLDVLSPDEAFELLTSRRAPRTDTERSAAQEIPALLGNHALAVDVTGAAIEAEGYQFLYDLLRSPQEDALEFAAELADELPGGHAPSIAATLLASIRRLNEDGLRLLQLATLLAPAPIPQSLVASVFARLAKNEKTGRKQAALGIKAAIGEALIERVAGADDAADAVSVHVLVSRTIRFHAGESPPKLRDAAVVVLTERMAKAGDIRNHPNLLPLVPHARALTEHLPDASTANLLVWLGSFNLERGAYADAEADNRRTFEFHNGLLGAEHPATLTSISNLALTLSAQGDYAGARALQEKALAVRRRVLGAYHPATLTSMNDLASALWAQGDYAGARALQEEALTVGCYRALNNPHLRALKIPHPFFGRRRKSVGFGRYPWIGCPVFRCQNGVGGDHARRGRLGGSASASRGGVVDLSDCPSSEPGPQDGTHMAAAGPVAALSAGGTVGHAAGVAWGVSAAAGAGGAVLGPHPVSGTDAPARVHRQLRYGQALRGAAA